MNINNFELGKRISDRRKELGLKQYEVCEKADLSNKYLSNLERGISLPSLQVFLKLCEILNTTPDELLLGIADNATTKDYAKHIENKIQNLNKSQINLILNFIDWVETQEIHLPF